MTTPKIIACIPARYASSRFKAKLMQPLGSKSVIRHTYDNTLATGLFAQVIVITDSELIYNEITQYGGTAIMSIALHESGSDRIAEAVASLDVDIIINVQGDEPFVQKQPLQELITCMVKNRDVQVASLMLATTNEALIQNPNEAKVVIDVNNNAILMSRSPIPYILNPEAELTYYLHIGVYGYTKAALLQFSKWPLSPLENAEKLEQLRFIQNGMPIKMVLTTHYNGIAIDVPSDLIQAEKILTNQP